MRQYQRHMRSTSTGSWRRIAHLTATIGMLGALVATLVTVTARALLAQASTSLTTPDTSKRVRSPRSWSVAHVSFGSTRLGSRALNANLMAAGLPALSDNAATIGAGASVVLGRMLIGASGNSLVSPGDVARGYRVRASGGYGMLDLGVVARAGTRTMLAVVGGAGAARLDLRIRDTARTSFDSVTSHPRRGADLSGHTALWHVGASYDVIVRGTGTGSVIVGLRAGYLGRIGASRWHTDGDRVSGGPSALVDGPYVRLTVGSTLPNRRASVLPALGSIARWLVP